MIKQPTNWKDMKEAGGDFPRLVPGGYVIAIKRVNDNEKDQFLEIEYEVCEGEFKGIALNTYERFGNWNYKFRVYYREKSLPFFKHFISSVEKTNNGFTFDFGNVNCLVNKGLGVVIGIRQYYGNDGSLKNALEVQDYCTANDIREDTLPSTPKIREPKDPPPVQTVTEEVNFDEGDLPF